jgi:hypothetical protein
LTPTSQPAGLGVEWLRSCYGSKWRCFNNTALETPGEYVFLAAGAPHCPIPHIFGSTTWITEEGPGQLGEFPGFRRTYSKGQVPFPIPPGLMLGTPAEVTHGAAFPHPAVPRTLPDGFDSRLWTQQGLVAPTWPGCGYGTAGQVESARVAGSLAGTSVAGQLEAVNVDVRVNVTAKAGQLEAGSVVHHP